MRLMRQLKIFCLKLCPIIILRDMLYLNTDIKLEIGEELLKRNPRNRYFLMGNLVSVIEMVPVLRIEAAIELLKLKPPKQDLRLIINLVPIYRIEAGKQLIDNYNIGLIDAHIIRTKVPTLWNRTKDLIIIQGDKKVS